MSANRIVVNSSDTDCSNHAAEDSTSSEEQADILPNEEDEEILQSPGVEEGGVCEELNALERDIRNKRSTYYYGPHTATDSASDVVITPDCIIVDDDVKKKLAVNTSQAMGRPGAFDSNNPDKVLCKELPLEMLAQVAAMRHEQKNRRHQDMYNEEEIGPNITGGPGGSNNEELPLDDMQVRMNAFISEANKEADKDGEVEQMSRRRKRRKMLIFCAIGLFAVIGVVVGVVVGIGRGDSTNWDNSSLETDFTSSPSAAPNARGNAKETMDCLVRSESTQSMGYYAVRAAIASEYPDMEISMSSRMSNARWSLCWLVHEDSLRLDALEYVAQRFVLALIYFHFADDDAAEPNKLSVSNWLSAVPECGWDFVVCENKQGMGDVVTQALFDGKFLTGRIPSEFALLDNLSQMQLSHNHLTGELPVELWTMTQLEMLDLNTNAVSGTFPNELVDLSNLRVLLVGNDMLTGTLPDLRALSKMEVLQLTANPRIVGQFPQDISGWTNLGKAINAIVYLSNFCCKLLLTIPQEKLWLFQMDITGTVPTHIGSLTKLSKFSFATLLLADYILF